ncbi:MAG: hypothetical protein MO852_01390 [Candidatus Devosia euplotis]|nr:hypothetical protein [Candidatus Devosia euplotis]
MDDSWAPAAACCDGLALSVVAGALGLVASASAAGGCRPVISGRWLISRHGRHDSRVSKAIKADHRADGFATANQMSAVASS